MISHQNQVRIQSSLVKPRTKSETRNVQYQKHNCIDICLLCLRDTYEKQTHGGGQTMRQTLNLHRLIIII